MKTLMHCTGDLFQPYKTKGIFVHACNAQGVWGSGIAVTFKEKYPDAYRVYNHWCGINRGNVVGKCLLVTDHPTGQKIGCLITSRGYGFLKDPEVDIVEATFKACLDLFSQIKENELIRSPKINAGKFGVPWNLTESLIHCAMASAVQHSITWEVYTYGDE